MLSINLMAQWADDLIKSFVSFSFQNFIFQPWQSRRIFWHLFFFFTSVLFIKILPNSSWILYENDTKNKCHLNSQRGLLNTLNKKSFKTHQRTGKK
jgi:hypothetical protein